MAFTKNDLTLWVQQHTQEMINYTLYKIPDIDNAQDVVQETFAAAVKALPSFKGESSPKTWLFGILKRKIADFYRQIDKVPVAADPQQTDPEQGANFFKPNSEWEQFPLTWNQDEHLLDNASFLAVFVKCKEALPNKWATALEQKYFTDASAQQICKELEISPTNYWQIIHRAKLQLRNCLEINWFNKEK